MMTLKAAPTELPTAAPAHAPRCRFCDAALTRTFVDLGTSPLCQRHVTPARFNEAESFYPLHAYVCERCFLVQLPQYAAREEIFDDQYAYFSSFSDTWLAHAKQYVDDISARFNLGAASRVVEIASNDGYLLQYFVQRGVPVLGIEPTANTAAAAEAKGVKSLVEFFGTKTARQAATSFGKADLLLGNNVLAHVPDINDFVAGLTALLADRGVVTMEFPVLSKLIEGNYFDTIYHEHFSYLSFTTVEAIFARHGLTVFDVQELTTHGGSIRVFARHAADASQAVLPSVATLRAGEKAQGHGDLNYYAAFGERVRETKRALLSFLIDAKRAGKTLAAYGAPGKGNTLLNYCGVRTDFIEYTVDRSPHKQGNFLPGTRIPILHPDELKKTKPDYVLILPWNLEREITQQHAYVREWGAQFVVPIPTVRVI